MRSRKSCLAVLLLVTGVFTSAAAAADDRNWVAAHVFDSIYPMTDEQSFPEALSSLELINQLFTKRLLGRELEKKIGIHPNGYGTRSREGHYLLWIHFSDAFVRNHPGIRQAAEQKMFLYPNRDNDIFTAWSGDVNLGAFLTQGVRGLGAPIIDPDTRKPRGNFQAFSDITPLGDADYEAGWYMTDEQAERILTVFKSYKGPELGYSFLRPIEEKPNPPYEPANAQLVNGYNCGDFVFYALTTSGVISKDTVESLKINFWYPRQYFDRPLPLKGVGKKGYEWLIAHPGNPVIPGDVTIKIAWFDLLFNPKGVEFFDKELLVEEFWDHSYPLAAARIWDQAHAISYLMESAEFRSKGIVSEILPAVQAGVPITSPERTVVDTPKSRYRLTKSFHRLQARGDRMARRKLKSAHIYGKDGEHFRTFYNTLKQGF